MLATLRRLNSPPRFDSEELTQRARMVHVVTMSAMAIVTALTVAMLIMQPNQGPRMMAVAATLQIVGILVLDANRRGRVALAAGGIVATCVALIAINATIAGGVMSPGMAMYSVIVLMAGILLGERAGIITAIACTTILLAFAVADVYGLLPEQTVSYVATARWLLYTVYLALVLVLLRLANEAIAGAMRRVETELAERRAAQQELAQRNAELDKRVKELRLLHDASKLLRNRAFEPAVLHELVSLIPAALLHPNLCAARIAYGTVEATSEGYRDSRWRLGVPFRTSEHDGVIEVVYTDQPPEGDAESILVEERDLLLSLRDMLVGWLERDVAERAKRGVEAQLRQSQKMEALGTLAGGIAHDFNNIIGAIVGQAALGKTEAGPGHQSVRAFEAILAATRRASDLVNRILLFSRGQEAERKAMALRPVVEEAIKLLQVGLPKNVKVRSLFDAELPHVSGDASQLFQVVMNLGTNAIHAMTPGGGTLTISLESVELGDTATKLSVDLNRGPHIRLSVSDTGIGIPREALDRLFEPFFTTKGVSGTGLGLSVVHGIVKDHSGAVAVESEVGKGTTVSVYLPASAVALADAVAESQPVQESETPSGNGEHVLYVDDDQALVNTLSRIIKRYGYRCTAYDDPDAALRDFANSPHSFDAVLTDYMMPAMNGVTLAKRMREIRPEIPIGVVSGFGVDVASAEQVGIDVRIAKPVSIEVLTQALQRMLRSRKAA